MKRLIRMIVGLLTLTLLVSVAPVTWAKPDQSARLFSTRERKGANPGHPVAVTDSLFEMAKETVTLNGDLRGPHGLIPFAVSGRITRSAQSNDRLIIEASDLAGNFDVVYFAVERDAAVAPFFSDVHTTPSAMVRLYLIAKSTHDFIAVELSDPKIVESIENAWHLADGAPLNTYKAELWHAKAFVPTGTEEVDGAGVGIMGFVSDNRTVLYRLSYTAGIKRIYEDFTVRHYLECPDDLATEGTCTSALQVDAERTWSPDDPGIDTPDTWTSLDQGEINFGTAVGDYARWAQWDGTWVNKGSINFNVSISYTYRPWNSPIGVSFKGSYESTSLKSPSGSTVYVNPQAGTGEYIREHGSYFPSQAVLDDLGHELTQTVGVGHYTSPGYKQFQVKYKYRLSNYFYTSFGGFKTFSGSVTYYSHP